MRFAPAARRDRRGDAPALLVSLVVHALLVAALVRWHDASGPLPAARFPPPAPSPSVVTIDFPLPDAPLPATASGAPSPYAAPGATPTPGDSAALLPPLDLTLPTGIPASAATPGGAATGAPGAPASAADRLRGGIRDPRLRVGPRGLEPVPERTLQQRMVEDARAAVLGEPARAEEARRRELERRQVTILGRRITVLGDSAAAGFRTEEMELRPDVQTLSVDGALWERLELSRDRAAFVRDSILRERARATRERIERERARGR